MIASTPQDAHGKNQFAVQAERVRKECPLVLTWLNASVADTKRAVYATEGFMHYKEVGALRDLERILDIIANPPELSVDGLGHGQDG